MYDIIIIGSGISCISFLLEIDNKKILVLDTGKYNKEQLKINKNILTYKKSRNSSFDYFIGNDYESMINVIEPNPVSLKLKSPNISFVIDKKNIPYKIKSNNFVPFVSFAKGGLANAWGSGLFRFNDTDLKLFPISYSDIKAFYNKLTDIIGINGLNDDLTAYFNFIENLLPPIKNTINGKDILKAYNKNKFRLNKKGIYIGRTQLSILTKNLNNRKKYNYYNTSFFETNDESIFNPNQLLNKFIEQNKIKYLSDMFVDKFTTDKKYIKVETINLLNNKKILFKTKKLIIATGTINTARLILNSYNDYKSRLPILDNAISFIPFINIRQLGNKINYNDYEGGVLSLIFHDKKSGEFYQGSIYSYISPLISDVVFNIPFSIKDNLFFLKNIIPSLTILQMFYPDYPNEKNYIQLTDKGDIFINYQITPRRGIIENRIIKEFIKLGFLSSKKVIEYPPPGNSIHYAGSIPMEKTDLEYFVNKKGQLNKDNRIYIIDASTFPVLPAKNLSFTIMANAMRIANLINNE